MAEVRESNNEEDGESRHKLHHVELIKDLKEFGKKSIRSSKFRKNSSTLD